MHKGYLDIQEVPVGTTNDKSIISQNTYMMMYQSLKGGPDLKLKKSFHANCRCCGAPEWEFHLYEPVKSGEENEER